MRQATEFIKGKYYVISLPGENWSDYEGPFDTSQEALDYLKKFIDNGFTFSPEMLKMAVVVFDGERVDLVKDDDGTVLNGEYLYWLKPPKE